MKSIVFLRMFWRLCRKSSDWCVNEKECKDSVGKRWRSSTPGDMGPLGKYCAETEREDVLDAGRVLV